MCHLKLQFIGMGYPIYLKLTLDDCPLSIILMSLPIAIFLLPSGIVPFYHFIRLYLDFNLLEHFGIPKINET